MKMSFIILLLSTVFHTQQGNSDQRQHTLASAAVVEFTIGNAGIPVTGTIDSVKTKIKFDPAFPSQSVMEAWAYPVAIRTGIAIRDKHLKRRDYFDTEKFPAIHIISKAFQKKGKEKFTGQFDLTIKDITRPVTISFSLAREKGATHYKGAFTINRLDFQLGEESAVLAENVTIEVDAAVAVN